MTIFYSLDSTGVKLDPFARIERADTWAEVKTALRNRFDGVKLEDGERIAIGKLQPPEYWLRLDANVSEGDIIREVEEHGAPGNDYHIQPRGPHPAGDFVWIQIQTSVLGAWIKNEGGAFVVKHWVSSLRHGPHPRECGGRPVRAYRCRSVDGQPTRKATLL